MDPQICRKGPAEGGTVIEIKRNCSSSIRDCDGSASLTFGSFTIKFTGAAYHNFKYLKQIREDESQQLLASIIAVGLDTLKTDQHDYPISNDDPDGCPYGGTCFMPGCDCYNDCPRYPHRGDDW